LSALEALNHNWIQEQTGCDNRSQEIMHTSERSGTFKKFIGMQKLKKAALGYIATNLSPIEVGYLGDIFRKIDTDGDGRMTLQEIDSALMRGTFKSLF
jgi:calcium-dependent protein kinase